MKKMISGISLCIAMCLLGVATTYADMETKGNAATSRISENISQNYQHVSDYYEDTYFENGLKNNARTVSQIAPDEIYETGKNIIISQKEVDQYIDFYKETGKSDTEAEKLAVKEARERNALYVAAMQNGYSVTDEEVEQYLIELKSILQQDDSGVYQAAMSGFDSEESYWDYEFEVYKVNLPIQKYVAAKEQEYAGKTGIDKTSNEFYESWNVEFENLKEQLVDTQNFK